tara:strand:+ start:135 stop:425 length:291 start_codon:yes stop_codon:yes gene_type:complete
MARLRRPSSSRHSGRVEQGTSDPWPNLQELIDSDGQITIGRISQFIDAAVANDEHTTWAMLQRHDGESLVELMTRLDQAVQKAIEEEEPIDEINPP